MPKDLPQDAKHRLVPERRKITAAAAAAGGRPPPGLEDAHGGVHQEVEAGEEMGGIAAGGRAPLPRLVGFGHVEGLVVVLLVAVVVVVVVVLQVTCYLRQPGGERGGKIISTEFPSSIRRIY
jgi:hypothetical protein